MDWENDVSAGEFILIKCWRKLDPTVFTDIFNDILIKNMSHNYSKDNGVLT